MGTDGRLSPQIDPILLRIQGKYVVVEDGESAIACAREGWKYGGDQADEWMSVHQDMTDALASGDHGAFREAVKRFRSAAHVSGWLDPHPMITINPPDSGGVSARDAAVRRARSRKTI